LRRTAAAKQKGGFHEEFSVLLIILLAFAACDNGTTSGVIVDEHIEFRETLYIGMSTDEYGVLYWYITNPDFYKFLNQHSPAFFYAVGNDWDNTPQWKVYVEEVLEEYQIKKDGKLVSYSDLPDYSGTGERNNRLQHYVVSWRLSDKWSGSIPPSLAGTWRNIYTGEELFSIGADGSGSIGGQGGYKVQVGNHNVEEVRFTQGRNEIGKFLLSFNGGGSIWIFYGTGPFAAWVYSGTDGLNWFITKN
jgi:hypothetical protein